MKDFLNGPFTLALSSGFFGFYAHVGFLKALEELQITPSAYSGTSAGGLVAAAAAQGLSVKEIEKLVVGVTRKDFWDPRPGFGFLRGQKFRDLIEKEIGTDFSRLKHPLRISVFDIASRSTVVLTSGRLALAVQATCAVPLMFHPVKINSRYYYDGGIQDKAGLHGLKHNEKILSHLLTSSLGASNAIYELRNNLGDLKMRGNYLRQVQLDNLPKSHPFAMHRGPEIIEAAYKQTLNRLK